MCGLQPAEQGKLLTFHFIEKLICALGIERSRVVALTVKNTKLQAKLCLDGHQEALLDMQCPSLLRLRGLLNKSIYQTPLHSALGE